MKKASWAQDNLGILILLIVVVFLLLFATTKGFTNWFTATNPKECKSLLGEKGLCKTGGCTAGEERAEFNVKCKIEGETCCIPTEASTPTNPTPATECSGLVKGIKCDVDGFKFCDDALQCITKCDFCHKYPADAMCTGKKNSRNVLIDFSKAFSCGCTSAECTTRLAGGNCIVNYCSKAGADFCCVK